MATEAVAQESCCKKEKAECPEKTEDVAAPQSRFTIGGYGEAAMSRNFYSQHFNRYRDPQTYAAGNKKVAYDYDHVKRMAFGVNYSPIKQIIVKGEYSHRFLDKAYNNEPSLNLAITFNGLFNTAHWYKKSACKDAQLSSDLLERINELSREVEQLKQQQQENK